MTQSLGFRGRAGNAVRAVTAAVMIAASSAVPVSRIVAAEQVDAPAIACTQTALNNALSAVQGSGGGTITFGCTPDEQLNGVEILITATKQITSPVTINGGNFVSLKADVFVPLFSVAQGRRLTLRNIKLIDGSALAGSGGAVYLAKSTALDLSNVTIRNSYASSGGAIYAASRDTTLEPRVQITIVNSTLAGNTAANFGGAIYAGDADVRVFSSTLGTNLAANGSGGAIAGGTFGGGITLINSTVTSNTAFSGGGLTWSAGPITISQSTLSKNVAKGLLGNGSESADGGAIETAGPIFIESSQILTNSALRNGGGIVVYANALAITGTKIANNRAINGAGGALHLTLSTATLTDTHVISNAARLNFGGGMFGRTTPVTISHSTVVSNAARDNGGGLYLEQRSPLMLWNSQILSNTSQLGGGAGVHLHTPLKFEIGGSLFQANAGYQGGGLNVLSGGGEANRTIGTISSTRFFSNSAPTDDGGGIRLGSENLQITMTGNVLSYNKASSGGGISASGVVRVLTGTVTHNEANYGAGIYWNSGDAPLYVANSDISHNRAVIEGSGVPHAAAIYSGDYPLVVQNSRIFSNTSEGKGGAIYSQGVLTVTGSTFAGNSATIDGGALSLWGGDPRVVNSTFSHNSAPLGGAVFNREADAIGSILHSTFYGNAASIGAGIAQSGSLPIQLKNSVMAHGPVGSNCGTVTGTIVSLGGNLISDGSCNGFAQPQDAANMDPGLGPLANNGGVQAGASGQAIFTHLPISGSLAVDAAACDFFAQVDQRGIARPQDADLNGSALCDKGAVERTFVPIPPVGGGGKRAFLPALKR